jgi:hypothetical protein
MAVMTAVSALAPFTALAAFVIAAVGTCKLLDVGHNFTLTHPSSTLQKSAVEDRGG